MPVRSKSQVSVSYEKGALIVSSANPHKMMADGLSVVCVDGC